MKLESHLYISRAICSVSSGISDMLPLERPCPLRRDMNEKPKENLGIGLVHAVRTENSLPSLRMLDAPSGCYFQ